MGLFDALLEATAEVVKLPITIAVEVVKLPVTLIDMAADVIEDVGDAISGDIKD